MRTASTAANPLGPAAYVDRFDDDPRPALRLVTPLPMAAERIRQRARHPVQEVPMALDGDATLSERDAREQQAIADADAVEGILP